MKKFHLLLLVVVGLLMSTLLIGCGQATTEEEEAPKAGEEVIDEEVLETEEMTATYIGLIDNHSFEVVSESGEALSIRFTEQFLNQLEPVQEAIITFTYQIDENGQYELVEIIEIQE